MVEILILVKVEIIEVVFLNCVGCLFWNICRRFFVNWVLICKMNVMKRKFIIWLNDESVFIRIMNMVFFLKNNIFLIFGVIVIV